MFAWDGEIVGSMANTARWPGVHVHWLFTGSSTSASPISTPRSPPFARTAAASLRAPSRSRPALALRLARMRSARRSACTPTPLQQIHDREQPSSRFAARGAKGSRGSEGSGGARGSRLEIGRFDAGEVNPASCAGAARAGRGGGRRRAGAREHRRDCSRRLACRSSLRLRPRR
jgi:hypothetical protein